MGLDLTNILLIILTVSGVAFGLVQLVKKYILTFIDKLPPMVIAGIVVPAFTALVAAVSGLIGFELPADASLLDPAVVGKILAYIGAIGLHALYKLVTKKELPLPAPVPPVFEDEDPTEVPVGV